MEDHQIVSLFWQRSEQAIQAASQRYGRYCYTIAYHILTSDQDAEESVNDTWLCAWNGMPPHRPAVLSTFLGKLTRRISLNKWRDKNRAKRGGGQLPLALDELAQCLPDAQTVESQVDGRQLTACINAFLQQLPAEECNVFVSRYWFLASVQEISQQFGFTESKTKSMLHRTRLKLKDHLQKEGAL